VCTDVKLNNVLPTIKTAEEFLGERRFRGWSISEAAKEMRG
jgi:hypothetical protein